MTLKNALTLIPVFIILGCLGSSLAGCGIKPDSLDPPPGAKDTKFPQTYPQDIR